MKHHRIQVGHGCVRLQDKLIRTTNAQLFCRHKINGIYMYKVIKTYLQCNGNDCPNTIVYWSFIPDIVITIDEIDR